MVRDDDLLRLVYTSDLTEAGIAYALRRLVHYHAVSASFFFWFQAQVINKAVELAFRRFLVDHEIPMDNAPGVTFRDIDETYLVLGDWRCNFRTTLLTQKGIVDQVIHHPEALLSAAALVQSDIITAWEPGSKELYLFSFVTGATPATGADAPQKQGDERHGCWLVVLDSTETRPRAMPSLGKLELTWSGGTTLTLSLGGCGRDNKPLSETITLLTGERISTEYEYTRLEYLRAYQRVSDQLRITSHPRRLERVVNPGEWKDLWFEGSSITICGFISHPEFSRLSRRTDAGSSPWPHACLQEKYRMLKVSELHPLSELFDKARASCRSG